MTRVPPPSFEPSGFLSTLWPVVERAKTGDETARSQVYRQYRKPVERFVERRLPPVADAEALADDVMLCVLDPKFLCRASREKGRFRDLLLAVTRHRMANYNRWLRARQRDYRRNVSLEDLDMLGPATNEERRDFDLLYADEVLHAAMDALRRRAVRRGSPEAGILGLFYGEDLTQAEIALRLGLTIAGVNNHLDRGRKRLKGHLLEVLKMVCRDEREVKEEAAYLMGVLSRRHRARKGDRKA